MIMMAKMTVDYVIANAKFDKKKIPFPFSFPFSFPFVELSNLAPSLGLSKNFRSFSLVQY